MTWGFETEPEFQAKLDWVKEFVREEIEPLQYVRPPGRRARPAPQRAGCGRCRSRYASAACGPATWGRNWAARVMAR